MPINHGLKTDMRLLVNIAEMDKATGFYDISTGGVFDMWNNTMSEQTTTEIIHNAVDLNSSYLSLPIGT